MMYEKKMVAAIKVNGKVLREIKDCVLMPFNNEYSILLKNLNTTRAVVNIFIDGDNVVPGGLVLEPGKECDLERSIKNNNLTEGNKFKFIERTAAVEDGPRGIKLEDGLIRIEFQFEKYVPPPVYNSWGQNGLQYPPGVRGSSAGEFWSQTYGSTSMNIGGAMRGVDHSKGEFVKSSAAQNINQYMADNNIQCSAGEVHDGMATCDWNAAPIPKRDIGITVPGSKSEQKFQTTYMGALEAEKHTIVLKLLGELNDGAKILSPVTVHHKPKCVTCGKQNKAHAKFCTECGTALEIFA
jgi:hypothetical protein